jgi:hypothetical protein
MTSRKRVLHGLGSIAALVAMALLVPGSAEAHGRGGPGGHGGRSVVVGGFYGYPYYGVGFYGPFWDPFFYGYAGVYLGPEGGLDMGAAMVAGYGAIDMNVKPGAAEVWVDGKYVAEARDLDGYPSYLWLPEGVHKVAVYRGGYALFEEGVEVRRGFKTDLKVRLEKGESEPPGRKPGQGR